MAALEFIGVESRTTATNPETLIQIITATNQRCLVHAISVQPQGSTAAVAPWEFDLLVQTTAGTSGSAVTFIKSYPQAAESLQTTGAKTFTAEPAASNVIHSFSTHPQSPFLWRPPRGPLVIPGNTRVGLRFNSATSSAVKFCIYLEE